MSVDPFADYLPEGSISLGFVASVKALDPSGEVVLHQLRSADVPVWEAAGMLTAALDDTRDSMRDRYQEVEGDD